MSPVKVVLINPLTAELSSSPTLGVTYIADALIKAGYQVEIIDANARFGDYNIDRLYHEVKSLEPDVIGYSFCTLSIPLVYKQIKALKDLGKITIAGGPHPTVEPEEAIDHGVDVVVIGEGEETIIDFSKLRLD